VWEASLTPISLKRRECLKTRHLIGVGDPSHKFPNFNKSKSLVGGTHPTRYTASANSFGFRQLNRTAIVRAEAAAAIQVRFGFDMRIVQLAAPRQYGGVPETNGHSILGTGSGAGKVGNPRAPGGASHHGSTLSAGLLPGSIRHDGGQFRALRMAI
jgi:hypothetical protein